jgi:hypothetical protein
LILSGTNGLSDVDGDASTPAIRGTDGNTGIFFGSDVIGFSEGGTEAMRINADAQIVAAAGTNSLPVYTTTGDLNTGIYFPAADNIGFATGGTIRGRWTTDGLCFNADTAAANALDDYEEGTFTPTIASGIVSTTYSNQFGFYTKIGRVVSFSVRIGLSAGTANAEIIAIGSLPFTVLSTNGYHGGGSFAYVNSSMINSTSTNLPTIYVRPNTASLEFYKTDGSNFTGTSLNAASTLDVYIVGQYFV